MSAAASTLNSPAVAQAVPAAEQAPGFYRYKVGDITVTAINDGYGERPLEGFIRNADLAAVTKAAEAEFFPAPGRVRITFTTLVLQTGGKTVLIDVGNGDVGAPTTGRWMGNFRAAGFDPAKVDTVLISHFHGDHINGLRLKDGSAVFPNAEVLVGSEEWDFWMDDGRMSRAPEAMQGAFGNVRRVFAPMAAKVGRYQGGKEVAPGVTAVSAFGHSPGHTCFVIASGSAKLIMMSDVTNHPGLFVRNPDWSAVFDMDADMARATRRRMLDMVATERLHTAFYHAPFPATGFVAKDGDGFRFVPVQWS
jgi:glyoxylase-like metal-dependent hydrolase (beta-lactamase superfamily II)